ncbi:MAG: LamG-like jellyroll fold domain-containing protein [Planctomycetota bacterium]
MTKRIEKRKVLVVVLTTCLATSVANAVLVARWNLDETNGITASDSSGNEHNGTLRGGLSFDKDSVTGVIANALEFDGRNDRVIVPVTFSMPTDGFTIGLWFSPDPALDSSTRPACLVHWAKDDYPCLMFNKLGRGEIGLWLEEDDDLIYLVTETHSWDARMWYHIAVTFDGADLKVYINGHLENTVGYPTDSIQGKGQFCFGATPSGMYPFKGKLDDVCIYGGAHSAEKITGLLRRPSALEDLVDAVQQGEAMVKEHGAKKAIAFFEKKIAESERWRKRYPDKAEMSNRISAELSLQLVRAKEAAGFPKKDIVDGYKHLIESGRPSLAGHVYALVGLYDNTSADEYQSILGAIVQNDRDYLLEASAKAGMMISQRRPKLAVALLEATLASYSTWRQEHPYEVVAGEENLPEIYFQLAKAKEAAGAPKADITKAYAKTFTTSSNEYVPERTAGLIWLLENEQSNEYTEVIKSFIQLRDIREPFTTIVRDVCRDFESRRSWAGFERFLDTVVAESKHPIEWVTFLDTCLTDKANRWAKKYFEYLDSKPRLKFRAYRKAAEENMAAKNFKKAAELYEDILSRCGPEDDKGQFEFQLDKCLFHGGEYQQAISRLENFIANYRTAHGNLVKEAMLMKSQGYIHSGKLDKALDSYLALMIEYPETKDLPEISFFLGYCYMLKGDLEAAEKAFESVIEGYPHSPYATRAGMCMIRIKHNREAG